MLLKSVFYLFLPPVVNAKSPGRNFFSRNPKTIRNAVQKNAVAKNWTKINIPCMGTALEISFFIEVTTKGAWAA